MSWRCIPNFRVHRLHHPRLGLLDGDLEALGLAVALHRGRGMADGAVGVHPDVLLPRLGVFPGIHLSWKGRKRVPGKSGSDRGGGVRRRREAGIETQKEYKALKAQSMTPLLVQWTCFCETRAEGLVWKMGFEMAAE